MVDSRPFAGRVALITGGAGAGMGRSPTVVAFLVSDESSYITGEVTNVSGGWYLSA